MGHEDSRRQEGRILRLSPQRKHFWEGNRTTLELWEEHLKDPIISLDKAVKCVENQYQGSLLVRDLCEIVVSMTCGREGSGMVPELWGKPLWEKVWPHLDPWDSVRLRTASTHCNVPGKYGPHGDHFFFLMKKEQVVASNKVSPNPFCLRGNA